MKKHERGGLITIALAILGAFFIGALFIMAVHVDVFQAYGSFFSGSFGRISGLANCLVKTVPIVIIGLGLCISFRAGITNLGGDGQFYLGAIASTWVATTMPGPDVLVWIVSFLAAVTAGGLWGALAGYLKARFNTNEVIMTMMMNFVVVYLLSWLVDGPMKEPGGLPQTAAIRTSLILPRIIQGTRAHAGIFIMLALVFLTWYFLKHTTWGYYIKVCGKSEKAARYAGINPHAYTVGALFLSGAYCGLAGMVEIFGVHHRLLEGLSDGFGFTGIIASLLGNLQPFFTLLAGLFIGLINVGTNSMQVISQVPVSLMYILQSLLIVFMLGGNQYRLIRRKKSLDSSAILTETTSPEGPVPTAEGKEAIRG